MPAVPAKMGTSSPKPERQPEIVLMKSVILCAAVLALFALAGCEAKEKKSPPPSGEAVPVKAGELLNEYAGNAVAADGKYKGKLLRITGKFSSASKAPLMGYAVMLVGEDAPDVNTSGVQCFIVQSAEAAVG